MLSNLMASDGHLLPDGFWRTSEPTWDDVVQLRRCRATWWCHLIISYYNMSWTLVILFPNYMNLPYFTMHVMNFSSSVMLWTICMRDDGWCYLCMVLKSLLGSSNFAILFVSVLCKHVGYYHAVTLAAEKLPQLIYLLFVLHLSYSLYDH